MALPSRPPSPSDNLIAWRLTKAAHVATALTGYGATLRSGRWHTRGRPVVYAASSAALALLETLVHAERAEMLKADYLAIPLRIPGVHVERLDRGALPPDWQAWPHPASTQQMGSAWFDAQGSAALMVPSAVVPHEFNVLLNPLVPGFHEIEIGAPEPFPIDARLTA